MRSSLALAFATLTTVGCATHVPKPTATTERAAASSPSSFALNIQANEIKEIAIMDPTASTKCEATGKDRTDATNVYYSCATTAKVAVHVKSEYLNVDQVYGGLNTYVITGYASRDNLADPKDAGSVSAFAEVQAHNLNAIGRQFRKLADGCMGESVVLSYGGDKIDLQTGEYFGDLRCRITKKNAKVTAGAVYYLETAKAGIKAKYDSASAGVMSGVQVLAEVDKKHSDTIGWMVTQSMERAGEVAVKTKDKAAETAIDAKKLTAETAANIKKITVETGHNIVAMSVSMKDFVLAQLDAANQVQQRTRVASAEALRNLSEKIRP